MTTPMKAENEKLIGKRIRVARKEAGFSQEQLGSKVGYSAMGISHIENGDRKIKLEDLQEIANELGLSIAYLLEPIANQNFGTVNYRRGEDEITDEQKKAEQDSMIKLEQYIRDMDD